MDSPARSMAQNFRSCLAGFLRVNSMSEKNFREVSRSPYEPSSHLWGMPTQRWRRQCQNREERKEKKYFSSSKKISGKIVF